MPRKTSELGNAAKPGYSVTHGIGIYFGISRIISLTVAFRIKLSGYSSLGKRSLLISGAAVDLSRIEGAI